MTDDQWHIFFITCAHVLGSGARHQAHSESWCAWTTFDSLKDSVHYWSAGLPTEEFIARDHIRDSGPWGQPFLYRSLAHIVLPREFYWEVASEANFSNGTKCQDLNLLSVELKNADIPHRVSELILEIKLY